MRAVIDWRTGLNVKSYLRPLTLIYATNNRPILPQYSVVGLQVQSQDCKNSCLFTFSACIAIEPRKKEVSAGVGV